jgi:hypothetical protein
MKSCAYAYAIVTSHTDKRVNVFKMKKLEKIIMSNPKEMNWRRVANS